MNGVVSPGTVVSHYRILSKIGAGGMGVVYVAEDERLQRKVALKFVSPSVSEDPVARARLLREARAVGALDHPNIATVYEVGEFADQLFIAMAYYGGETLRSRLERGPLPMDEGLAVIEQIAGGLAAAHAGGIVHRDLKPANIMLTGSGQVKILDFGLAKDLLSRGTAASGVTEPGIVLGTLAYMAPEQASGEHVDERADIWALGAVIHESLTGKSAFDGGSPAAVIAAALTGRARALRSLRPDAPKELEEIVESALVADPAARVVTASRIAATVASLRARTPATRSQPLMRRVLTRPAYAAGAVGIVLVLAAGAYAATGSVRRQWARRIALPEIARLADQQDFGAAFDLASRAERYLHDDPQLAQLWTRVSRRVTVDSRPSGATIKFQGYGSQDTPRRLGVTPLRDVRLPQGWLRVSAEKAGFDSAEDVTAGTPRFELTETGKAPLGMVRATAPMSPGFPIYVLGLETRRVLVNAFWVDRFEVTNGQYKAFVDAGGYTDRRYWQQPFTRNGGSLTWEGAMQAFRDATGRPGPATWELGTFAAGHDDDPVTGVSWFEASAYAAFMHRSLPTVFHWNWVASQALSGFVIPQANFSSRAPVKVGSTRALHRFGAYDLAGNVKEWCFNEATAGKRYILGGGFDEPPYLFRDADARSPFDRAANFGFRTVKYDEGDTSVAPVAGVVLPPTRNYAMEKPVGDAVFDVYRRLFSYDPTDLRATVDSVDDANPDWRMQRVSMATAYGQERLIVYLFVPKSAKPPYQTVVYMPGGGAWDQHSRPALGNPPFGFLVRSGRAVAFPIFKGSYERGTDAFFQDQPKSSNLWREYVVDFSKDLGRTLDYLATRPEFDMSRIGYLGFSRGGALAPVLLSQEPRIKTAVLWIPGLYLEPVAREVDAIHYASRMKIPVLQLSGKYDYNFPDESSSRPFFNALGTPADRKRRVVYDTGHNLPLNEAIKETMNWLDGQLGVVR